MKSSSPIVSCLFALLVVAGCASTEVTDRQRLVTEKLPRPGHIWVYDFAATPAEVPADSALAGQPTRALRRPKHPSRSSSAGNWAIKLRRRWSRKSATWHCQQGGLRVTRRRRSTTLCSEAISSRSRRAVPPSASPSVSAPGHPS